MSGIGGPDAGNPTGGQPPPRERSSANRRLIVNADDFGRSPGVNRGILHCHEHGIVTSASLMVRWPDAAEAAASARGSSLAIGLHFDLGEWVFREGEWRARYEVLPEVRAETVAVELDRQLERFYELVGAPPTHFDSHQHVHNEQPTKSVVVARGAELGVPVRAATPEVTYSGAFHGQDGRGTPVPDAITVDALLGVIDSLPNGTTELGCHPAAVVDHESTYAEERLREVEALCDPRVRAALERQQVKLLSFPDLHLDELRNVR